MSAPHYLPLDLASVPSKLRAQPFIGWRETRDEDGKPHKTPFQIGFPMEHASNDEAKEAARAEIGTPQREPVRRNAHPEVKHWRNDGDVAEVLALAPELFDGFGIVLTATAGLTFIDLDHVRDPETGGLEAWAEDDHHVRFVDRDQRERDGRAHFLPRSPARAGARQLSRWRSGHEDRSLQHRPLCLPHGACAASGAVAERQRLITLLAAHVRPAGTSTASAAGTMQSGERPIPAGARNDTLFRIARGFVLKGLRGEALVTALLAISHRRCVPVPPDADVVAIARHADRLPDRRLA